MADFVPTLAPFADYPAGIRGFLYFESVTGMDSLPVYDQGLRSDPIWGTTVDDSVTFATRTLTAENLLALPCSNVTLDVGSGDYYASTGDAVPPTVRVKNRPIGGISFSSSFPVVIGSGTLGARSVLSSYATLLPFLKREGRKAYFTTSQQPMYANTMYPCVLEKFSIQVDGTSGAGQVQCSLKVSGIHGSSMMATPTQSPVGTSKRDDNLVKLRDDLTTLHASLMPNGGRLANIKDCLVTFGGTALMQVVKATLEIDQSLVYRNTASVNDILVPAVPLTSNHLYIKRRVVSGNITFLASTFTNGGIINDVTRQGRAGRDLLEPSESSTMWQPLAAPLRLDFGGGMNFTMSACYYKTTRLDMPAASASLYSLDFIARAIEKADVSSGRTAIWGEFE